MTELIATAVITMSSALLLAYWFRYTCLLILSARTTRDYAAQVVTANRLSFVEVQARLRSRPAADLDHLHNLLDQDYRVVSYLLKHAGWSESSGRLESNMLAVDYRLMQAWYGITRSISSGAACRALDEMSRVVAHFANTMGERAAGSAAA
jgi:hypothetical protein